MICANMIAFGISSKASKEYWGLKFTAEEPNATFSLQSNNGPTVTLETSPTGEEGSWQPYTIGTPIILENVGDKVMFRNSSDEIQVMGTSSSEYNCFKIDSGKIAASGNIMFLMDKTGELRSLDGKNYCYSGMFRDCTALTQAPELPATTLVERCYYNMFRGCTSLTQAPELPATTLADYCYAYMFKDCSPLIQAPVLPATTLAERCYYQMFQGCTSLTQAPELPATTLAKNCYYYMFRDCTALTQAPLTLPATTLADYCYQGMFHGCTSLTKAPELPATTLAAFCYFYMFDGCIKLNNINVNFSTWIPSNATKYWVSGVSSSGTFTCPEGLPDTPRDESHIPEGWTIQRK